MQNHTLYFQPFLTYNLEYILASQEFLENWNSQTSYNTYSKTLKAFWYLPDKSQKMKVNHLDKEMQKKVLNQQRCSELQRYPNMCVVWWKNATYELKLKREKVLRHKSKKRGFKYSQNTTVIVHNTTLRKMIKSGEKRREYYLIMPCYLTAPNMAAKVNNVVMAIVTRPGMDSGGKKRESQATMTKSPLGRYVCSKW